MAIDLSPIIDRPSKKGKQTPPHKSLIRKKKNRTGICIKKRTWKGSWCSVQVSCLSRLESTLLLFSLLCVYIYIYMRRARQGSRTKAFGWKGDGPWGVTSPPFPTGDNEKEKKKQTTQHAHLLPPLVPGILANIVHQSKNAPRGGPCVFFSFSRIDDTYRH